MEQFDIYTIGKSDKPAADTVLRFPDWSGLRSAEGYVADQPLADAVNVALCLGQPLLLTGEAGTGKTLLAYSVAHKLGLGKVLKFETKSNSESHELFYTYNALARFQAAQLKEGSTNPLDYLQFNALGLAILKSSSSAGVDEIRKTGNITPSKQQSVVLIDEIDKAPRDFPNDILNEIELMRFHVPELGNREISADIESRPIVILTSNSEKNLPDAFLRRCVFYHIPFPNRERLETIVNSRLASLGIADRFLNSALDFFEFIRTSQSSLVRRPATAELLNWIVTLRRRFPDDENPLERDTDELRNTLCTLLKTIDDQQRAESLTERWMEARDAKS